SSLFRTYGAGWGSSMLIAFGSVRVADCASCYSQLRGESIRQSRLTPLQEAADRWFALETDSDLICASRLVVCSRPGQQLRARSPIRLVVGQPHVFRQLLHRLEASVGTLQLGDGQGAIYGDN